MTELRPQRKNHSASHSHAEHEHLAHVIPLPALLGVFLALLVLTGVTVAATGVDLGRWNLPVAMAIATVKATLVALFFMHLLYDPPLYGMTLCVALLFVALFIAVTLIDTIEYQPDLEHQPHAGDSWRRHTPGHVAPGETGHAGGRFYVAQSLRLA